LTQVLHCRAAILERRPWGVAHWWRVPKCWTEEASSTTLAGNLSWQRSTPLCGPLGMMAFWQFGILASWYFDILTLWHFGHFGILKLLLWGWAFWHFDILAFWHFGILAFRSSFFRSSCFPPFSISPFLPFSLPPFLPFSLSSFLPFFLFSFLLFFLS